MSLSICYHTNKLQKRSLIVLMINYYGRLANICKLWGVLTGVSLLWMVFLCQGSAKFLKVTDSIISGNFQRSKSSWKWVPQKDSNEFSGSSKESFQKVLKWVLWKVCNEILGRFRMSSLGGLKKKFLGRMSQFLSPALVTDEIGLGMGEDLKWVS